MKTAKEIQRHLWRHYGSHEAAPAFLDLDLDGELFWPALRLVWCDFDLIPMDAMVEAMDRHSDHWAPCQEWQQLPETFTAYRGQDRSYDGICWSRDRAVAEQFCPGTRGITNPDPILRAEVLHREAVALVIDDRDEAEVVTWKAVA